ncbi:MAG TPA: hypothetical protein V6D02_08670, partial [Candidatus Obscuribacterales bacterium]
APQYWVHQLVWPLGLVTLGVATFRLMRQPPEQRLYGIVSALIFGGMAVVIYGFAVRATLQTVNVTAAHTIDFVYRAKSESWPLRSLVKISGTTTRTDSLDGSSNATYRAIFSFQPLEAAPTLKEFAVPYQDLKAGTLGRFVSQLEERVPQVDTAEFWQWHEQFQP